MTFKSHLTEPQFPYFITVQTKSFHFFARKLQNRTDSQNPSPEALQTILKNKTTKLFPWSSWAEEPNSRNDVLYVFSFSILPSLLFMNFSLTMSSQSELPEFNKDFKHREEWQTTFFLLHVILLLMQPALCLHFGQT